MTGVAASRAGLHRDSEKLQFLVCEVLADGVVAI